MLASLYCRKVIKHNIALFLLISMNWEKLKEKIQIVGVTLTFVIPVLHYVYWQGYLTGFMKALGI